MRPLFVAFERWYELYFGGQPNPLYASAYSRFMNFQAKLLEVSPIAYLIDGMLEDRFVCDYS